jgi:hypothetical protein
MVRDRIAVSGGAAAQRGDTSSRDRPVDSEGFPEQERILAG